MNKVCNTCEHWLYRIYLEDKGAKSVRIGVCTRYPPIPLQIVEPSKHPTAFRPAMCEDEWCGEWSPVIEAR